MISARTGLLVLLGHPVGHSVSPAMHNAAAAAADLDLVYLALDVSPADLPVALAGLPALGVRGANLTVPHKRAGLAACRSLTDEARAVGAVNTLVPGADGLVGDNTDVAGFVAGLPHGIPSRAVVLGAGGAARAVVVGLVRGGAEVTVLARDPGRAAELATLDDGASGTVRVVGLDATAEVVASTAAAELVVNATPLGWHGEQLPAPLHDLSVGQVAYDCNYPDQPPPFLVDAAAAGAAVVDGLAMVVGQAAAAFESWTGVVPDVAAMTGAARAARRTPDRHDAARG